MILDPSRQNPQGTAETYPLLERIPQKDFLFLELSVLAIIVLVVVFYFCGVNLYITMIIYLTLGLIVIPAFYVLIHEPPMRFSYYFVGIFRIKPNILLWGLVSIVSSFVVVFLLTFLTIKVFKDLPYSSAFTSFSTKAQLSFFIIFYVFLKPISDEMYWRNFLLKSLPNTIPQLLLFSFQYCIFQLIFSLIIWQFPLALILALASFPLAFVLKYLISAIGIIFVIFTHIAINGGLITAFACIYF